MQAEHLHDAKLKVTRRESDGEREFSAMCLTCGQDLEAIRPVPPDEPPLK